MLDGAIQNNFNPNSVVLQQMGIVPQQNIQQLQYENVAVNRSTGQEYIQNTGYVNIHNQQQHNPYTQQQNPYVNFNPYNQGYVQQPQYGYVQQPQYNNLQYDVFGNNQNMGYNPYNQNQQQIYPNNVMPIGTVGYNSQMNTTMGGGYYNPYNQGYYNPYVMREMERIRQAQYYEMMNTHNAVYRELSKCVNASRLGRPLTQEEELSIEKRYTFDPRPKQMTESQLEEYETARMYNLCNCVPAAEVYRYDVLYTQLHNQAKQVLPDNLNFVEFLDANYDIYIANRLREADMMARDLSKSYNSQQYRQLLGVKDAKNNAAMDYYTSMFNKVRDARNQNPSIDDMTVTLPPEFNSNYEVRKKGFFDMITADKNALNNSNLRYPPGYDFNKNKEGGL